MRHRHRKVPRVVIAAIRTFLRTPVGVMPAIQAVEQLQRIGANCVIDVYRGRLRLGRDVRVPLIDTKPRGEPAFVWDGGYTLGKRARKSKRGRFWVDMTELAPGLYEYAFGYRPDGEDLLALLYPDIKMTPCRGRFFVMN